MHDIFQTSVYSLCFITCGVCAFLLVRAYVATRARLLFWSALCFVFLAANSLLVIIDILILPRIDLALWRQIIALAAVSVLLFGFIWELEEE